MSKSVGIVGLGTYLPPDVRKNDWWPAETVASWKQRRPAPLTEKAKIEPKTAGERAIAAGMAAFRDDPFHGAIERRVLKEGLRASDMEVEAARAAIENAKIDPKEIGLVLCNSVAPDYFVTNNACLLHHNLGLATSALTMATEAGCNAFMAQLALAQPMVASGRAKYALLVQSCNVTRLLRQEDPLSAWFGDGCAAVVLGPVQDGCGILAHAHRTHGEFHRAIVASVPDRPWYEEGRVCMYSADHEGARRSFLGIADFCAEVAGETLAMAGVAAADVDFYAPHQPTPWFRRVTQEHLRLTKARSVETFEWAGSMFGANIPVGLSIGQRENLLRSGDLVLMFAGGAGLTYSSMLMRWGG